MPDPTVDVAIVGAGPVGCALALALKNSGLRIGLVGRKSGEAGQAQMGRSLRPVAMSYASRLILERVGAWEGLKSTPIEQIHVSQAGGFGRTRISREDLGLPALGYVAEYADIAAHMENVVDAAVRIPGDALMPTARLVVHAEGSTVGEAIAKDYGHTAIVAAVESERPARNEAWERFTTSEGPLALLPLGSRYGMVWSRTNAAASALMGLGDRQFLAELQSAFGRRAGRFRSVGPRSATPLALRYRSRRVVPGEAYIGNAAQTLHPVAGQGLNLGLRDAWDLAALIRTYPAGQLGASALAERFAHTRRLDAQATIRATDLMATLYVRGDPVSAVLRGTALAALDVFPPLRKAFARRMIYGASAW